MSRARKALTDELFRVEETLKGARNEEKRATNALDFARDHIAELEIERADLKAAIAALPKATAKKPARGRK